MFSHQYTIWFGGQGKSHCPCPVAQTKWLKRVETENQKHTQKTLMAKTKLSQKRFQTRIKIKRNNFKFLFYFSTLFSACFII